MIADRPPFLLEGIAGGQRHIAKGTRHGYHLGLEQPEETKMFAGAGQYYNQLGISESVRAWVGACVYVHALEVKGERMSGGAGTQNAGGAAFWA